jgi:PAS domain S-box-containing protein
MTDNTEQRRAEAALRASEHRLKTLSDASFESIFLSENGICLDQNLTAERMFGYTREEAVGRHGSKWVVPEDRDLVDRKTRLPEVKPYEATALRRDGSTFPAEIQSREFFQDGRRLRVTALRDISGRKQTEEALKESEDRLRTLINALPDLVCFKDGRGRWLEANDFDLKLFRLDGVDYRGKTDVELSEYSPFYRDAFLACVETDEDAWRAGEISRQDEVIQRPDGPPRVFDVIKVPTYYQDGRRKGLVVVGRDVTDRQLAEEALKRSEEKFRLLSENANMGIFILDESGYRYVNQYGARLFGLDPDGFMAADLMEYVHPDDRDDLMGRFRKRLAGETVDYVVEHRIVDRLGHVRWLETNGAVTSWEGNPAVLAFAQDVTARKTAEQEREMLQAQLQQAQKMEAVGTLAGGIAHDFNNLLQAIGGYTQILLRGKNDVDPERPHLEAIQAAGARAAQLVQKLLLFSRKLTPQRQPVDLNLEVDQARHILERTIPKMVAIEVNPAENLWAVNADPVQIEQIILNLGVNAADAMPDGGRLIVETQNVTLDDQYIQTHLGATAGDYVLLTVSDTGVGMDRDTLEHIFEPFYTTKDVGQGTGLGLASAYGVVKSHGGYIMCYSEIGQGTTFRIYLPAAEQSATQRPEKKMSPTPRGGTETILIVDDEQYIIDVTRQILMDFGYNVLTAGSGEEALEYYTRHADRIDLVIMDLGMPGMGGYQCLLKIKEGDPSAKILIASGYSLNEKVKEGIRAGAAGYVGKPYHLSDLLNQVRDILDRD